MTSEPSPLLPPPLTARLASGRYDYHRSDADRHGVAPSTLSTWVKRGWIESLGGGDYVIKAPLLDGTAWEQQRETHLRRCRAVLAGHSGLYLVARSSASARGLPLLREPTRVEVSSRPRCYTQRASVSARMPWGSEPEEVHGMACQQVAECVMEISAQDGAHLGLAPADAALHAQLISSGDLQLAADRFGARRGAGAARLVARLADGRIESPGESLLRWQAWEAGVELIPQVVIHDSRDEFVARVDFVIVATRVVVEFDGLGKYATAADLRAEKLRQLRLERAGYSVVRFTFADLRRAGYVAAQLRAHAQAA